jgi:hypothetical protein
MIAVVDRRDAWVGLSSVPATIESEPWLEMALIQLERNGALFGVHGLVRAKKNLTLPALSETPVVNTQCLREGQHPDAWNSAPLFYVWKLLEGYLCVVYYQ